MRRRAAMMSWTGFFLLAGPPSAPTAAAQAPNPDAVAAVDGTVVDSAGRGIGGVEVLVMDRNQLVRTNTTGAYRLDSLDAGLHVLRFRRLGLRPVTLSVQVVPNDVTGVDVVMGPMVYMLATVEVQGTNGDVFRIPKELADRMHGPGQFLTEADIAKRHPLRTSDIFRGLAGLYVPPGGTTVVSQRRGTFNTQYTESKCPEMPVYINGGTDANATAPRNSGGESGLGKASSRPLETVDPTEIVGIEIYRGPSTMPAGMPTSPCGAIVIWTK